MENTTKKKKLFFQCWEEEEEEGGKKSWKTIEAKDLFFFLEWTLLYACVWAEINIRGKTHPLFFFLIKSILV